MMDSLQLGGFGVCGQDVLRTGPAARILRQKEAEVISVH